MANNQTKKPQESEFCHSSIPEAIAKWLIKSSDSKKGLLYQDRARRFVNFWEKSPSNAKSIEKAWQAIQKNAKSDEALLEFFITLPDQPKEQPFSNIFGERSVAVTIGERLLKPGEELQVYKKVLDSVNEVERFLNDKKRLKWLLSDSAATPWGLEVASEFRTTIPDLKAGLKKFKSILEVADPSAKVPSKQPNANDVADKNYVSLLAALNGYLTKPCHAAIASLANANCLSGSDVATAAIGAAWRRSQASSKKPANPSKKSGSK